MQDRELRICEGVSIIHAKQAVKFGRVRHGQDQVGLSGCLDPILVPWLDKEIKLLELGMYQGRSLELWRDYFPRGDYRWDRSQVAGRISPRETVFNSSKAPGEYALFIRGR